MGTLCWRNWRAEQEGAEGMEGAESSMYSDARFFGQANFGPYALLSTEAPDDDRVAMSLVLRLRYHLDEPFVPEGEPATDTERYVGGFLSDELAALVALASGARVRSGGDIRKWYRDAGDPLGTPVEFGHARPYLPEPGRIGPILPRMAGSRDLEAVGTQLSLFPSISEKSAVALVRAARMYAQAIWVADDDPNLAWILLVGALEAAAVDYKPVKQSKVERLAAAEPRLYQLLHEQAGPEVVLNAAELLVQGLRVKAKLLKFVEDHLPEPPHERPSVWGRLDWERMPEHMVMIYDYRSRALHSGLPFPVPMCERPRQTDKDPLAETPEGHATWAQDGAWVIEDTPMLLTTFEYIARSVLQKWWQNLPATAE